MSNLAASWNSIKLFDELAGRQSVIHRIHPIVKLLTTLVYVVCTISFDKYEVTQLLPLVFYPVAIIVLADLPVLELFKRMLVAAPFALSIGIFNPFFDRMPLLTIVNFSISGGWLSFCSIILRFGLTVMAALILIATSGIQGVGMALLKLKLPRIFVTQLLLLYRYLSILLEEVLRTIRAYSLRSLRGHGIPHRIWGSLTGQLLLRTIDRAERIYQAMLCRGFDGEIRLSRNRPLQLKDYLYFLGWSLFFLAVRYFNIPNFLGGVIMGVGR